MSVAGLGNQPGPDGQPGAAGAAGDAAGAAGGVQAAGAQGTQGMSLAQAAAMMKLVAQRGGRTKFDELRLPDLNSQLGWVLMWVPGQRLRVVVAVSDEEGYALEYSLYGSVDSINKDKTRAYIKLQTQKGSVLPMQIPQENIADEPLVVVKVFDMDRRAAVADLTTTVSKPVIDADNLFSELKANAHEARLMLSRQLKLPIETYDFQPPMSAAKEDQQKARQAVWTQVEVAIRMARHESEAPEVVRRSLQEPIDNWVSLVLRAHGCDSRVYENGVKERLANRLQLYEQALATPYKPAPKK